MLGVVFTGACNLWGLCSDVNRPGARLGGTCGEVGTKSKELIRCLDLVWAFGVQGLGSQGAYTLP